MHDIKAIRDDAATFVRGLSRRGIADAQAIADGLLAKDRELRDLLLALQTQQARRNEASKLIGQAKAKKDEAQAAALMAEVAGLKDTIQKGEQDQTRLEQELRDLLAVLPNLPADDVPNGVDETDNVLVHERTFWGHINNVSKLEIEKPKQHFEIGEALGQMDFERAAKVSGARFVYLKGDLARLERALGAFMLDTHTSTFGYTEVSPPVMVNDKAMFGTGQLPKFEEDLFATENRDQALLRSKTAFDRVMSSLVEDKKAIYDSSCRGFILKSDEAWIEWNANLRAEISSYEKPDRRWLIPTSEVSLTNYISDEILNESELPLRFTAHTPCFRAEAGSAGRDTRGMIRMHQFSKVELVSITVPERSEKEHEHMTDAAQAILKKLGLKHRVVTLCTGDMGFSARKTYDIEVWLPGQDAFREISSCSNCGDFQARRMNSRYRNAEGKVKGPVHTLNGSGLAVGRTMVAILENYQQADGSVAVPDVLVPYMGGKKSIAKA